MNWYRGFRVYYYPTGSQHWKAERHGVTMNARTIDSLKRVIDVHIQDREDYMASRKMGSLG